jgi:hypothetical protein
VAVRPGRGELDAPDASENVDAKRRQADLEYRPGRREIAYGEVAERPAARGCP